MNDNELKKFEDALSARREMEELIFCLNDVLSSWCEDLSFIQKNIALYDLNNLDDREELINYGWYLGSAKSVNKNIILLKEIVKKYENKLLKGR